MLCPVCSEDTRVIESRKDSEAVYRVRECRSCKYAFCTVEEKGDKADLYRLKQLANRKR